MSAWVSPVHRIILAGGWRGFIWVVEGVRNVVHFVLRESAGSRMRSSRCAVEEILNSGFTLDRACFMWILGGSEVRGSGVGTGFGYSANSVLMFL